MCADCITARRKSSLGRPSKAVELQPTAKQATSYAATSSAPPMGGTCLTVCSNAEARHFTQRVLHYLESLKDVKIEREGTRSSFTTSNL
jgi:hypothetical protein